MASNKPRSLSEEEIESFVSILDHNGDSCISYQELEDNVDKAYDELKPYGSQERRLELKPVETDQEKQTKDQQASVRRHEFIRSCMGTDESAIPVDQFKKIVRSWEIPSLEEEQDKEKEVISYLKNLTFRRRARAIWEVHGPEYLFLALVTALQLGLGIWQCLKYALGQQYQAAFGWGVAVAKFSAGALYPTVFFLLLSMSRWWSTFMRRFYYISRFINWDHSQAFHIMMSIEVLVLASLHAIGHLTGTFNMGSMANRQAAVGALLGSDVVPMSYTDYLRSLAGWSGLTALGLYYCISLMSMPAIRSWSYELFQWVHLLMFPFIALLMAHGSRRLLQFPVLGLILAFPTLLVLLERITRLINAFIKIPAKMDILDDETVRITCQIPGSRLWPYNAGMYILLQLPELSRFEWHPFTISTCIGREMQLHIKTDGDWTGKLRELKDLSSVRISGPFGAPAQRFYDFEQTVVVGAGIGITPFSGLLNDLQTREDHRWSPSYAGRRGPLRRTSGSRSRLSRSSSQAAGSRSNLAEARARFVARQQDQEDGTSKQQQESDSSTLTSPVISGDAQEKSKETDVSHVRTQDTATGRDPSSRRPSLLPNQNVLDLEVYRRVDLHWIVRDKNHLLWFSDLLNRICLDNERDRSHLDIRLSNHLTRKQKDLSLHMYRCLLERHRTHEEPRSLLTGLVAKTNFGRPDFKAILDRHYDEMRQLFEEDLGRKRRVGVFFCGAPVIGEQLADLCHELTLRGQADGSGIEYHLQIEVFG